MTDNTTLAKWQLACPYKGQKNRKEWELGYTTALRGDFMHITKLANRSIAFRKGWHRYHEMWSYGMWNYGMWP